MSYLWRFDSVRVKSVLITTTSQWIACAYQIRNSVRIFTRDSNSTADIPFYLHLRNHFNFNVISAQFVCSVPFVLRSAAKFQIPLVFWNCDSGEFFWIFWYRFSGFCCFVLQSSFFPLSLKGGILSCEQRKRCIETSTKNQSIQIQRNN